MRLKTTLGNYLTIRSFGIYILFICIYFVGVNDADFFLRIKIPYLNTPFLLSIMMTDLILLSIVMAKRITIGSAFNEKYDKIHDRIKIL